MCDVKESIIKTSYFFCYEAFFLHYLKIENSFLFIAKKIILQSKQYEAQKLKFIFNIIVCVYI